MKIRNMPGRQQYSGPIDRWLLFFSIMLILLGILVIILSQYVSNPFWQNLLLGIGLALAPSGILGLVTDWLVFGLLLQTLRSNTADLTDKTTALQTEINTLKVSTDFLKQSSDLGLEMIYPDRASALKEFAHFMEAEANIKDSKSNLIIVGSSIKGLLENVKNTPSIIKTAIENNCQLRILITHPEYSPYRENQEDRPTGAIEDEIFDGIRLLEGIVEPHYPDPPDINLSKYVKLYKGTPTCFMIVAGNRMLINPYPYEEEAYRSFCVAVRKVEPREMSVDTERTIYSQYIRAHIEKPWERNSVPYRHYWLEGPNPNEAWDRLSCYGDVFVVQDASHFYLAVYLLGQRRANVRGMLTSIYCPHDQERNDYIVIPEKFSVRLFDLRTNKWRHLDNEIGFLTLHSERRRGKASKEIDGNLLNDYLMLGLFDPEEKVINPHMNVDVAIDGLRGEHLPLFWIYLRNKTNIR